MFLHPTGCFDVEHAAASSTSLLSTFSLKSHEQDNEDEEEKCAQLKRIIIFDLLAGLLARESKLLQSNLDFLRQHEMRKIDMATIYLDNVKERNGYLH